MRMRNLRIFPAVYARTSWPPSPTATRYVPLRSASITSPFTSTFSSLTAIRPPVSRRHRPGAPRCARPARTGVVLDDLDGLRLGTLGALLGLELDGRAFRQRLEAITTDRAEMDENVHATAVRRDEAEALRVVEPFDGS